MPFHNSATIVLLLSIIPALTCPTFTQAKGRFGAVTSLRAQRWDLDQLRLNTNARLIIQHWASSTQTTTSYYSPLPNSCPLPLKNCGHTCHLKATMANPCVKKKWVLWNWTLQWDCNESQVMQDHQTAPFLSRSVSNSTILSWESSTVKSMQKHLTICICKVQSCKGTFSVPPFFPFFTPLQNFKDRSSLKSILLPRIWAIELLLIIIISLIMCIWTCRQQAVRDQQVLCNLISASYPNAIISRVGICLSWLHICC